MILTSLLLVIKYMCMKGLKLISRLIWNECYGMSNIMGNSTYCLTACLSKYQSYTLLALCGGIPPMPDGFPSQRSSNSRAPHISIITTCLTYKIWPLSQQIIKNLEENIAKQSAYRAFYLSRITRQWDMSIPAWGEFFHIMMSSCKNIIS